MTGPLTEDGDLLVWLNDHCGLELAWGHNSFTDEWLWQVHRSFGINDRQWELVAEGNTPTEALTAARRALVSDTSEQAISIFDPETPKPPEKPWSEVWAGVDGNARGNGE